MGKIHSLKELQLMGLNVPELLVSLGQFDQDKAVKWEAAMQKMSKIMPREKISIRTERDGETNCPHFPNVTRSVADNHVRKLAKQGYAIHAFVGIDPKDCRVKGNITRQPSTDGKFVYVIDYFGGPGTVREIEKKSKFFSVSGDPPEIEPVKLSDNPFAEELSELIQLYYDHRDQFNNQILEWSYYPNMVGLKKRNFIFWELRPWK